MRIPEIPQDIGAEGGVIGSMTLDPDCIGQVTEFVSKEDFYNPEFSLLYETIMALWRKGNPVDGITIRSCLIDKGRWTDDVFEYLCRAVQTLPHASNALYYAKIVHNKFTERQVLQKAFEANELAQEPGVDLTEKIDGITRIIKDLSIERTGSEIGAFLDAGIEEIKKDKHYIKSGFRDLDFMIKGFSPGNLVIVAGRPGMGKSSLMQTMFLEIAKQKKNPVFYSLEMSKEQLGERFLCSIGNVSINELSNYRDSAHAVKDFVTTDGWNGTIETNIFKMGQLEISLMNHAKEGAGIGFIDYLQCIRLAKSKDNLYQSTTEISKRLKQLALNANIPLIVGCQLNRDCEKRTDHTPKLSDLRDSGGIEQDADMIIFLYRADYYKEEDTPEDKIAVCHLAKNRQGMTGRVRFMFFPERYQFVTLEKNEF